MRTGPRLLTIQCAKGSKILQPTYRFGSILIVLFNQFTFAFLEQKARLNFAVFSPTFPEEKTKLLKVNHNYLTKCPTN